MQFVELLDQTRVIRDDGLELGANPFIFNVTIVPGPPKLRIIMPRALVSMA
jgi:hypothetical protein